MLIVPNNYMLSTEWRVYGFKLSVLNTKRKTDSQRFLKTDLSTNVSQALKTRKHSHSKQKPDGSGCGIVWVIDARGGM